MANPPRKPADSNGDSHPDHHKTAGAGGPGGGGIDAETAAARASGASSAPGPDALPGGTGYADGGPDTAGSGPASTASGAASDPLRDAGGRIIESGSAIGVKVLDQAEENAREAFGAMRAAASASDLAEVMRIQGEYLREQGNRSMAQAREIGELIVQFGRDAVTPLKPR